VGFVKWQQGLPRGGGVFLWSGGRVVGLGVSVASLMMGGELAVLEYLAWFNNERLHESLRDRPPRETEELYAVKARPTTPIT
jgi:hypothetical protein